MGSTDGRNATKGDQDTIDSKVKGCKVRDVAQTELNQTENKLQRLFSDDPAINLHKPDKFRVCTAEARYQGVSVPKFSSSLIYRMSPDSGPY